MELATLNKIIRGIRNRRNELGYTQNYIAGKLDMSQTAYSDIESNKSTLSVERFLSLCSVLKFSPAFLFQGTMQYPADFSKLFYQSAEPMWLFDPITLRFIEVNDAATHTYGFTRADFMTMTIKDIRPEEDTPVLLANLKELHGDKTYEQPVRHWYRDKTIKCKGKLLPGRK